MAYDLTGKRVWIAGHRGMVGQALVRALQGEDCQLLTVERAQLDLRDRDAVRAWMVQARPQAVIIAAAKVGGILANTSFPVDFLLDNLAIETSIMAGAHACGVEKLLFLASSAVYPRLAPQPMAEEALLTGPLEPTHEAYAIAKIAGIKLTQAFRQQYGADFIACLPTNLYGPGDRYDPASSHVMPALIRKVHQARQEDSDVVVWGSGTPRREFLHVDDCADACLHLMKTYSGAAPVNVGSGEDISILDLTRLVMQVIGHDGAIVHDHSKPDGPPRKLMDSSRLTNLGWRPKVALAAGIADAYRAFLLADR
jgi:GDP-L-fucose synthase